MVDCSEHSLLNVSRYVEKLADGGSCETKDRIKTLQGLLSGIQCFLGELPSFFVSGWLLRKFGHINVMSGILLFMGIRFTLYSLLTDPWWFLPIEILQATAGLSFATMASYASIVAPPGTEATVQGLVGATFEGIGSVPLILRIFLKCKCLPRKRRK